MPDQLGHRGTGTPRTDPDPGGLSRRRFLSLGAAGVGAAALGGTLAACGQGSAGTQTTASGGRTVLNFVTAKFESKTSMQAFVQPFNTSQSKYQVVVRELPPPSSSTEVHQQLVQQLGAANGQVDVFTQDVIWIAEFASAGWAMDLTSSYTDAERKGFFSGLVDACTVGGKQVAIPFYLDAGSLYYRSDLLRAAGLKPPTTWAELVTQSKQLMAKGTKNGFLWQGKQAEVLICDLVEFVASNGGSILGPDGKTVMIADDKAVEAVQFMSDTLNKSAISPKGVLSWDEEPSRMPFTSGQGAFLRQWTYLYGVSQDASQSKVVGKVGVEPLPHFSGGKSAACLGGYQLGVSNSSKNKDGALAFVKWMTNATNQLRFAQLFGNAPALSATYDNPALAKSQPTIAKLRRSYEAGTPRPITPKYPQITLALQTAVSKALTTGNVQSNLSAAKSAIEKIVA